MKKFALALVAVISTLLMCLSFAACSSDVVGNTYVFDDFKLEFSAGISDSEKAEIENEFEEMKEIYGKIEFTFKEDGSCPGIMFEEEFYFQEGDTIYFVRNKEQADAKDTSHCEFTLKVDGNKLMYTDGGDLGESDYKVTTIFKKK